MMAKNKMIAVLILVGLIIYPFQVAFMNIEGNGGIGQAIAMTVVIVGAVIAIFLFNKETEEGY